MLGSIENERSRRSSTSTSIPHEYNTHNRSASSIINLSDDSNIFNNDDDNNNNANSHGDDNCSGSNTISSITSSERDNSAHSLTLSSNTTTTTTSTRSSLTSEPPETKPESAPTTKFTIILPKTPGPAKGPAPLSVPKNAKGSSSSSSSGLRRQLLSKLPKLVVTPRMQHRPSIGPSSSSSGTTPLETPMDSYGIGDFFHQSLRTRADSTSEGAQVVAAPADSTPPTPAAEVSIEMQPISIHLRTQRVPFKRRKSETLAVSLRRKLAKRNLSTGSMGASTTPTTPLPPNPLAEKQRLYSKPVKTPPQVTPPVPLQQKQQEQQKPPQPQPPPLLLPSAQQNEKKKRSRIMSILHSMHPLSLRMLIFLTVLLFVASSCIAAWLVSDINSKKSIEDITSKLRMQVLQNVCFQVDRTLEQCRAILKLENGTRYLGPGETAPDLPNKVQIFKRLQRMTAVTDKLTNIFYGEILNERTASNPADLLFPQRMIGIRRPSPGEFDYLRSNGTHIIKAYDIDKVDDPNSIKAEPYDLLSRFWFSKIYKNFTSFSQMPYMWTGIKHTYFDKKASFGAGIPVYADDNQTELVGALTVMFYVDFINDMLMQYAQDLGQHGQIAVADENGNLIGITSGKRVIGFSTADRVNLFDLPSFNDTPPLIVDGVKVIKKNYPSLSQFPEHSNITLTLKQTWVSITRLHDVNLRWLIVVFMDEGDFYGQIRKGTRLTIIISALIVVLAVVAAATVAFFITIPIIRVASNMDNLTRLEFSETKYKPTTRWLRFYEIRILEATLARVQSVLKSFQKFVPPHIVQDILTRSTEAKLSVETKEITIFFSDIENFTSISESLEPDTLAGLLGEYLEEMCSIIADCHGTIDKFIGDAVMAFWNAPEYIDNHPMFACDAAVRCQNRQRDLRAQWAEKGLPQLKSRIGIHVGDALIGNIGSRTRLNYTIIGDNVNLGARLESLCRIYGTDIIISDSTYERVKSKYICRVLDYVVVKGKTKPIYIYEIVAERAEATEAQHLFCREAEVGLDLLVEGKFDLAHQKYRELLLQYRDNICLKRLRKRAKRLEKNKDDAEAWPGFEVLNEK